MYNSRKCHLVLVKIKLLHAKTSPRIFIGYLYGFWIGLSMGLRYTFFSCGMETGIFEGFLLITNQSFNIALLLIGFFILIADAPFVDAETYFVLIRSGGTSWRNSMVFYILVQTIIYESLICLGGMIPVFFKGNFTFKWSETMELLTGAAPRIAVLDYQLPILDKWMLTAWSAPVAFLHSFLLTFSYCFFLGLVIFAGNLNAALPVGQLIAVGIHLVGMLVMSDFVPLYWPSLVAHSILQYHIPGKEVLLLGVSYFLFAICIISVLFVLKKISQHTDYHIAVSQKMW